MNTSVSELFESISESIREVASKSDLLMFEVKGTQKKEQAALRGHLLSLICLYEGGYRETPNMLTRMLALKPEKSASDRKKTGSYFTPWPVVKFMTEAVLGDGKIADSVRRKKTRAEKIAAVLSTSVCDPCMGGGIFLIGAHDYLMQWVIKLNRGRMDPTFPAATAKCLYGVDINPEAVELSRELIHLNILKWMIKDILIEFVSAAAAGSSLQKDSCAKIHVNMRSIAHAGAQPPPGPKKTTVASGPLKNARRAA